MSHPRVDGLLDCVGLAPVDSIPVEIEGSDPVLASPFPVGEAAAVALAAVGVATAVVWCDRTGVSQTVHVDVRRAAAAIHAHRLQRLGTPVKTEAGSCR